MMLQNQHEKGGERQADQNRPAFYFTLPRHVGISSQAESFSPRQFSILGE